MPPLHTHTHLYCERIGDGLFAEPFNVLSNLGFFVAAWLLWVSYKHYRKQVEPAPEIVILIILTLTIGTGSAIFHSVATIGAALFDIIPIAFFVFFYVYILARSLLGFGALASSLMFLALVIFNIVFKFYVLRAADGYISYIPTFIFLLAIALYMLVTRHPSAIRILMATGVALLSLYLRTVDRAWCSMMPMGTHFIWHLLNAILIYLLVRELMNYGMYRRMRGLHGNT